VTAIAADMDTALIGRVNQLYHNLTQDSFDDEHRHRHRVERPFWQNVARRVLSAAANIFRSPAHRSTC